ncbi:lipid A deacylase LpxR family protein [Flavobacterium sp. ARAG 55.4]|uniref:lipid A deacylase LpxR family protein n=1 Tax=Flavobacterium sp. ARAG 55.4 TaxID=3451357 RepID=UPI003F467258
MQSKKVLFFCFFLLISANAVSQKAPFEIGIVTDNDLYTSTKNDQYYTNGLEIFYRYLSSKNKPNVLKRINEIKAGQYMYSPRFIYVDEEQMFDRPFAGYLFGQFGRTTFYSNQSVFKKQLQIGVLGPNSFADKIQKGTHRLFNYTAFEEWKYQIHNAFGLQFNVLFAKAFSGNKQRDRVDFHWQSEAKLGTIFTSFSTGFVTRIGFKKLVPLSESNFYGASLTTEKEGLKEEFYFYMAPYFNYQMYDATIQGSLFSNSSPVTFDVIPFRFNAEAGLRYRKKNLNLSYAFVYRGKELDMERNTGYFYGSIGISYIFNNSSH